MNGNLRLRGKVRLEHSAHYKFLIPLHQFHVKLFESQRDGIRILGKNKTVLCQRDNPMGPFARCCNGPNVS